MKLLFVLSLVVGLVYWFVRWNRKHNERMVGDFIERFPGRCMICSYHDWGRREYFVPWDSKPEPHDCIEERLNDN